MAEKQVETNDGKCPFIHNPTSEGLSGSSMSVEKDHDDTLIWTPNKSMKLHNYQTSCSIQVNGPMTSFYQDCRHHVCTSTLMSLSPHASDNKPSNMQRTDDIELKSLGYIRKEAHDYSSIYHDDKSTSDENYEARLAEIDREIQETGTYTHTTGEIEYGCQLAWRNAGRCINRLYWNTLKALDRRHVKTNDGMFEEICKHLRMAYNNGTLQATTLVMPKDARLWSTQYLRYACYEQADGSLLGDPVNRELTKVAMDLGWNKEEYKRTQWDLLPIIVQCDLNTPPSWYELPEDLCPIVFLSHPDPKYDAALKSLGLRWVAQPFVSDKAIEIGGIVYKCVPFSGWFMQTEIGRNLCDLQRYNIIPKLAALLDLDVTAAANSQLNIDRIYVEVNAAVLHSFQQAKVAIVDHHTAANGFMKFMNQEAKQRGNTPADWIWLVPPISGGMSSLFHQEMFNYVLKPRILDQRDPWTYYTPLLRHQQVAKLSPVKKRRHRWLVLRAACAIIGFALNSIKKRISVIVLYASASGTAQSYAQQMAKQLEIEGYSAKLMQLDTFSFQRTTETRSIILIITSTFGQGNAPEGGEKVEEWLQKEVNTDHNTMEKDTKQNKSTVVHRKPYQPGKTPLKWCTFAVCAIGSSAYPFFCGFGKLIDRAFTQLGAQRLAPLATCDALNQQYKNYNEWEETTIMALKKMYPHVCLSTNIKNVPSSPVAQSPQLLRPVSYVEEQVSLKISARPNYIPLEFYPKRDKIQQSKQMGPFTKENPFSARVLQNIELTGTANFNDDSVSKNAQQHSASTPSSAKTRKVAIPSPFTNVNNDEYRSVRLIVLETPDLLYYPGDHVCILPENLLANVNGVIVACRWQTGNKLLTEPCSLASLTNNKYQTLREILTHFVDLTTTPRPHVLNTIATYATNPNEQRQILELGKGGQRYTDWLVTLPTIKEMLEQFSSIKIPLEELIQLLPKLQPRYYSISSSSRFHPGQLHITVSVATYTTPNGVVRKGVCSHYLQQTLPSLSQGGQKIQPLWQRKSSMVRLFISPNPHFRLPGQENFTTSLTPEMVTYGDSFVPLNSPILMLAVGSGIAPFRSFLQELQILEQLQGSVQVERVLFMGCRTPQDFLYAKELQALTSKTDGNDKLLTAVIPVYSRKSPDVKRYIQDAMLEYEQMICSMLTQDDAFVYMCGSIRSCQGMESALASILQSCNFDRLTQREATNHIKQLKESGRIRQDMFG